MSDEKRGKLYIVGFGPGSHDHLTFRAKEAIGEADVIVGYETYIELVKDLIVGKEVIQTGMQEEVSRGQKAVELAASGRKVALVSSGDAGIYGMAGLIYDILYKRGWRPSGDGIDVEVIPGVSACNAVAALLGAPLMHDFAAISLSDLLTPWDTIVKRIGAAAQADFVISLYNPKSGRRTQQIVQCREIIRKYRSGKTPVGIVKSAYRDGQKVVVTDLDSMLDHEMGMLTTIIVGNSQTYTFDNLIVTPRGYQTKYTF